MTKQTQTRSAFIAINFNTSITIYSIYSSILFSLVDIYRFIWKSVQARKCTSLVPFSEELHLYDAWVLKPNLQVITTSTIQGATVMFNLVAIIKQVGSSSTQHHHVSYILNNKLFTR